MARVSAYPMVQVGEALETILAHASPLGRETVELTSAQGRILAQDVNADADLPGLPRSSVDGYAVIAADESAELEVLEEVTAGRLGSTHVRPGSAVRIMTGGTLPPGADAVVMVEEVEETDGRALLQHRPRRGEIAWQAHARDEEDALERAMRDGLAAADVLLTSGGVSMGTRDLIKPLLDKMATIQFGRVSFKPGKPLTFATAEEGKLAFGLPGFRGSSLITFEIFVRPALLKAGGAERVFRPRVQVALGHEVRPDPIRPEYQRASVSWEGDRFVARTTGLQSSSRLMSIVGANALLELQPGDQVLPEGTMVQALLLANL